MKRPLKCAGFMALVVAILVAIGFCGYVLWVLHGIGRAI
jgi:hypothetical protein